MSQTIKQTEGLPTFNASSLKMSTALCVVSLCYCPSLLAHQVDRTDKSYGAVEQVEHFYEEIDTGPVDQINVQPFEQASEPEGDTLDSAEPFDEFNVKTKNRRRPEECVVKPDSEEWVDKMRSRTHSGLCFTADWVDGLFGDEHKFDGESFRGKVSIGFREDEIEGFDPRLRVRIKTKLPNMSKRFNAFIGRVEEDSYISNTEVDQDQVNAVGLRSTNDDDSEWLIGIGYRDPESRDDGFDVSVGAKLSSGLSPYAKVAHRHLFKASEEDFWRATQTVFWRKDDGLGVSSTLDYTHIVGDHDILEWDTSLKYTEEQEQWEWISSTTWHHEFTPKKGISSRAYVRGERENPVSIPEFGLTFTYVRPFLRDWMFIETGIDFRWEKESVMQEEYKSAIRFGIQFQMLLGDYYKLGRRY